MITQKISIPAEGEPKYSANRKTAFLKIIAYGNYAKGTL
jgi:hypothetical protein